MQLQTGMLLALYPPTKFGFKYLVESAGLQTEGGAFFVAPYLTITTTVCNEMKHGDRFISEHYHSEQQQESLYLAKLIWSCLSV